ncbi:MAG TPA: O-methyltransferase [Actinomycetota bacterium]|nr:O-methyltransferase [Actinomycetota bacterium]
MTVQIVNEDVEKYSRALLARHDDPVLLEMEQLAAEKHFPIINRHVGVTVEILARSIGARRIFELGSGYGYSAYWFARAAGPGAEVHCTDGDPENAKQAEGFLSRAGLWDRITFHVGDAVTAFNGADGDWDIVYCDIDKHGYPEAWETARDRVKIGGMYICDNVLWSGRVAVPDADDQRPTWTEAIKKHNEMIAADERYESSILPIRDGVMVALRVAD